MSYHRAVVHEAVGLTADEESKLDRIIANQEDAAARRKTALILGTIGAVIAAARLGIVAVPMIHAARARPRE